MKKYVFIICMSILGANISSAQDAGKLRTGLEIGCLFPHEGGFGFLDAIEFKYNLQNNMNIGLKTEVAGFYKSKSYAAEVLSFSATYDYYFHSKESRFSPFIGAGLGYYFCEGDTSEEYKYKRSKYNNPMCLIRAGFEIRKFRMSLTYNLIRKSNEINYWNRNNDYVSLNIGFYIGGGKWK